GGKLEANGFYKGRLINRLDAGTIGGGVSFGHYVFGDGIALSPDDTEHSVDLLAHEYGHTYQSRIMGPMYLFRIGIASIVNNNGPTEDDADWRGFQNLGIDIGGSISRYKWYEFGFAPVLWPFMWMWNKE
ncbi:MAG: hypothetical protein LBU84_18050, partial [Prevotella sp.]|nr:hypothetical protein [Prevotella sp.]